MFRSACLLALLLIPLATTEKVGGTALKFGQILPLECLQRGEDGEIIEDENKQRVYAPFLKCNETGYPPAFKFRHSTSRARIACTVTIDDPTFHLFQAYLHHDMPLVCRLQSRREDHGHWAQIPINFVGKVQLSHVDIDPKINFIFHYDNFHQWVTGGVGYTVGPTVSSETPERDLGWQRVKIGDDIKLEFSIRWISTEEISNQHSHTGVNALLIMAYPFLGGIGFMVLCRVLYSVLWSRQKIASVRQTRFESPGINMTNGKGKSERNMV